MQVRDAERVDTQVGYEQDMWVKVKPGRVLPDRAARHGAVTVQANPKKSAATEGDRDLRVSKALVLPPQKRSRARFLATARWEGAVLERFATYFSAEVVDLDSGERSYVELEF